MKDYYTNFLAPLPTTLTKTQQLQNSLETFLSITTTHVENRKKELQLHKFTLLTQNQQQDIANYRQKVNVYL